MSDGFKLSCVLFDLDGTLVDTAPDLIRCLNRAISRHGFEEINPQTIRPFISYGGAAMVARATHDCDAALQKIMLEEMLEDYQHNIATHSHFFDGIAESLNYIEQQGLKWGIVTNKRERFTLPLIDALNLENRIACVISGDTTNNSKPHPEPMLTACQQAEVHPHECVYIGDAEHDILAGRNCKMKTLAAVYGYLKPDDQPKHWGADALIDSPQQLTHWIHETLCN